MAFILTDQNIEALIQERKFLPIRWDQKFIEKPRRGHIDYYLSVPGCAGKKFEIIRKKSAFDRSNFSVILGVYFPEVKDLFRLRRYNGNNHTHTNPIERNVVSGFHIHTTTERYQRKNLQDRRIRIDAYAAPTTRYQDIEGALRCLIKDANFQEPSRF
ncbi:MAG: hypothetical protein OXU23_02785 [Candidatus Poribacteria bacterium]|nr:hypothetical protein [Candidatus Poribacteria bacterium]